jgi:hypothetical protein
MFGEELDDINSSAIQSSVGTPCVKPGEKLMTSFIVADGTLESSVYSCNAVAPQLGSCDSSTPYEYAIINHKAENVLYRQGVLHTNETFSFSTKDHDLPRPFFGMFVLALNRGNYGASRFNVQWGTDSCVTSTHEISITGRPRVFLPLAISSKHGNAQNDIYLAIMNPRKEWVNFSVVALDPDTGNRLSWDGELGPFHSTWIDATEYLYKPAIERWPTGRFVLKVDSTEKGHEDAVSVYFFFRNRVTNHWSSQHL